jgi:hypothetical protein
VHEVAIFMQMYPAYKLRDVLNEYAVSFFALLNEGYRLKYADAELQGHLNDLPHMDKTDREKLYRQLEWASQHPNDILKPATVGADPSEIKKLLNGT